MTKIYIVYEADDTCSIDSFETMDELVERKGYQYLDNVPNSEHVIVNGHDRKTLQPVYIEEPDVYHVLTLVKSND
jgi:hypothetical protein